ncbi:MAG: Hsp20/alpha crystallin family protein [Desulfobulbus sp.]
MSEKNLVSQSEQPADLVRANLPRAVPEVDIFENEVEILLHVDMPGVNKEDITVNIDNGKMTLAGARRLKMSGASAWREFGEVEFRRTFAVPQSINVEQVSAELENGSLMLHLPKSDAAKPRQIEIKSA